MCEWRNKKRSKAAEACLKYSGPGGIQTVKPNAAALHLVWQYGGDAARRSPMGKISNFDSVSTYFWCHQENWKISPRRDLNQLVKTQREFADWRYFWVPLAKMTMVMPPGANMSDEVNSFVVKKFQNLAWGFSFRWITNGGSFSKWWRKVVLGCDEAWPSRILKIRNRNCAHKN